MINRTDNRSKPVRRMRCNHPARPRSGAQRGAQPAACRSGRVVYNKRMRPRLRFLPASPRLPAGLLLSALLFGCSGNGGTPAGAHDEGEPKASADRRGRVVVVGIDGADWHIINPLIVQGRLTAFARLKAEGATGDLESMEPSSSPSLWTTVATGVTPERHGIHGFVVPAARSGGPGTAAEPGEDVHAADRQQDIQPVTSTMRRAPAFWNILSSQGLRVGVVGWLVTWPAEPVDGFMVSSYLPYIYNWSTGRPLKGTIVGGIPHQTFPETLIEQIDALKVKPTDIGPDLVRPFYDPSRTDRLSVASRLCVEGFLWSLACDETYRRIGLDLFDHVPVDLFAVYFGGVDVVSHRFWKFAYPGAMRYDVTREECEILGGVIDAYYAHVDTMVGEYMERLGPEDTLVVLSDHGFMPVLIPGHPNKSGTHREMGILAIWGRGARRGGSIEGARLVDILPTLLTLLDAPIALDLEGQVLQEALDPVFVLDHEPRFIDGYEVSARPPLPDASDLDRNVIERLRSLGYIN
jgi:hypothetical protein